MGWKLEKGCKPLSSASVYILSPFGGQLWARPRPHLLSENWPWSQTQPDWEGSQVHVDRPGSAALAGKDPCLSGFLMGRSRLLTLFLFLPPLSTRGLALWSPTAPECLSEA